MIKSYVKISSLRKGDKFSFVASPDIICSFVKFDAEIDSIVFKTPQGHLNLLQFNPFDEVLIDAVEPAKVKDVSFDAFLVRENSVVSEVLKTFRLIEKNENVIIPPFTLSRHYSSLAFANADNVSVHNEKDCVIITITSSYLKKPYSLTRYKTNLHKN